jgi:hypothetical protein
MIGKEGGLGRDRETAETRSRELQESVRDNLISVVKQYPQKSKTHSAGATHIHHNDSCIEYHALSASKHLTKLSSEICAHQ